MAMTTAMANAAPKRLRTRQRKRQGSYQIRLGLREAVMGGLAVTGFVATVQVSIAEVFDTSRPQLALKAAPFDAAARSRLASMLNDVGQSSLARGLALDAIRRDPVQPPALREVATSLGSKNADDETRAKALILQSQRLSRRDLPTQMWLIDYFGRHADAASAIHQFDLALRVSEAARPRIFPLLEGAATNPQARALILSMLASKANWTKPFAGFLMENGRNLDFDATVARLLLDPRKNEDVQQYRMLLVRLVQADKYESAWDAYAGRGLARAGAASKSLRHGDFEGAEDGTPFDWTYAQDPELWAARERSEDTRGFVLSLAASNGRAGEVARQITRLAPGLHRLQVEFGAIPERQDERPDLRIECVAPAPGTARPLVSLVPPQTVGARRQTGAFTVPDGCTFQRLTIRIAGSGPQGDRLPWVDNIAIS